MILRAKCAFHRMNQNTKVQRTAAPTSHTLSKPSGTRKALAKRAVFQPTLSDIPSRLCALDRFIITLYRDNPTIAYNSYQCSAEALAELISSVSLHACTWRRNKEKTNRKGEKNAFRMLTSNQGGLDGSPRWIESGKTTVRVQGFVMIR